MFNLRNLKVFSMISAVVLLTPMLASAAVHFIEQANDNAAQYENIRPCFVDYPLTTCPTGKSPQNKCPTDARYFKSCSCDSKYQYTSSNCTNNRSLGGGSCDSKYETCSCNTSTYPYTSANCTNGKKLGGAVCNNTNYTTCSCDAAYSKLCNTNNLQPADASDSCGGYYKSCKCPSNYVTCTLGGAPGASSCTEENGTAKYSSCKKEVNCEAPYTVVNEECKLWDGVAAVAKTCNDLITITKNANIQGNVLVWGTLNCADNQITLPQGQNLVGRAFFKGKYTEATDVDTNKFSKINWSFSGQNSATIAGLHVEHNAKVSDVTLSMTSTAKGGTQAAVYSNGKQNLVFNNIDIYLDSSGVADDNYLALNGISGVTDTLTAKMSLTGKNYIRFNGKVYTGSIGEYGTQWNTRGDFRGIFSATVTMAGDSYLSITGNGTFNGLDQVDATMSGTSKIDISQTTNNSFVYGFTNYSFSNPLSKLTMKDNSVVNINAAKGWATRNGAFTLSGSAKMNVRGVSLSGDLAGTKGTLTLNDNAIINLLKDNVSEGDGSYNEAIRSPVTLNGNSQLNAKLTGKCRDRHLVYFGAVTLNGNSVLRAFSDTTISGIPLPANYYPKTGSISYYGDFKMTGNSKMYLSSTKAVFHSADFNLASTSKIYVKSTGAGEEQVFNCTSSDITMTSASGAKFIIQSTARTGSNGIYTVPTYSSKRLCSYYDCKYNGAICYTDYSILGASKSAIGSEQTELNNGLTALDSAISGAF